MKIITRRPLAAFAVLEYVTLLLIIVTTLSVFQVYIRRGAQGQMRKVGEGFGFFRQYNAGATIDCAYDAELKAWYLQACFDNKVIQNKCQTSANSYGCLQGVKSACKTGCTQ